MRYSMLLAALSLLTVTAQAAPRHRRAATPVAHYRIQALPLAEAGGLNDRGQVAGVRYVGDPFDKAEGKPYRAFLWRRGRLIPLGRVGTLTSPFPNAISNSGEVVGEVSNNEWGSHVPDYADAFAWRTGRMRALSPPGLGRSDSNEASGVNRAGLVVGSSGSSVVIGSIDEQNWEHAVIWHHGSLMDLGYGQAVAVNDRGQVVGVSEKLNANVDGFDGRVALWENGKLRLLGMGAASAINNRGQIVGNDGGEDRCFLCQNGRRRDLGVGEAAGINDRAQVIINGGWNDDKHDVALWQGGKRYNLLRLIRDPSGWASLSVTRINSAGVILGNGSYRDRPHAFLLTPQG